MSKECLKQKIIKIKKKITITKETQFKPIVFMNTPVSSRNDDVIGIGSAVNSIKRAIKNDANLIGVIADYGAGKSSLTETLSKKSCGKAIHINMWDSISKLNDSSKTDESINLLTKSFVFQLASGVSEHCARHANKRLSKNYNIFSFSISSWEFWIWAIIAAVFYVVFSGISLLTVEEIEKVVNSILSTEDILIKTSLAVIFKASAPAFMVLGIIFAIVGFRKTSIAFSKWKSESIREPEINDIFEAYLFIHKKLLRIFHHKIIIIEDLDRIKDKNLVIGFLKEIYRFSMLPKKRCRKSPVFIISVRSEASLDDKGLLFTDEDIYPKLFDYTVSLKPIHFEDYEKLVLEIIGDEKSKNRQRLQNLLESKDKITDNRLPESFKWIITGHNLTIRQLKDRLNSAVSLFITLKNKGYTNQSFINFSSCAAVTYLEHQYPQLFDVLLKQEEELSKLVRTAYTIKNNPNYEKKTIKEECTKLLIDSVLTSNQQFEKLKDDLVDMLENGDITDDFRMYFYSFPKNSYIKNSDERDISNLLLLPNDYKFDDELNEKINRIIESKKEKTIIDALQRISDNAQIEYFPKIVFMNADLFSTSYNINPKKLKLSMTHWASWEENDIENSKEVLNSLMSFFDCISHDFWDYYTMWLSERFYSLSNETRIRIRKQIIPIVKEFIVIFDNLYVPVNENTYSITEMQDKYTLISNEEFELMPTNEIGIQLINVDLINENNFKVITKQLNLKNYKNITPIFEICLKAYNHIKNNISVYSCWNEIIVFLKINNYVDDNLFGFAISGVVNKEEKSVISEYVSSLKSNIISEEYLELINKFIIDVNLSNEIAAMLCDRKMFSALLSFFAKENRLDEINFTDKTISEAVIDATKTLLDYDDKIIPKIREEIIRQFINEQNASEINTLFSNIFYDKYPLITESEISLIPKAINTLTLLDRSKITAEKIKTVIDLINNKYAQDDCITIFNLLLGTEYSDSYANNAVVINIINGLNYNIVKLRDLSSDKKSEVLNLIKKYYDLSNAANAINFMKTTNCLFSELEKIVASSKKENYIELISCVDNPTDFTMKWLEDIDISFELPRNVLKELLDRKQYKKYLVGKVLSEKRFCFPYNNVPNDIIVSEYSPKSHIWQYLSSDLNFINYLIKMGIYKNFLKAALIVCLKPLYKGAQTVELTKFILDNVAVAEQINYLNEMGEILDDSNRIAISQILSQEPYIKLLANQVVLDKVQEKLWGGASKSLRGYKSSFTRKNKEYFKNK